LRRLRGRPASPDPKVARAMSDEHPNFDPQRPGEHDRVETEGAAHSLADQAGRAARWMARFPRTALLVTHWPRIALEHAQAVYDRWEEDDGPLMAAAVAYYVGLSFFPLLLILVTGVGLSMKFTHSGRDAEEAVLFLVDTHLSSSAGAQVQQALEQVRDRSTLHGPVALFMMLFSSIAGFVQLQRAFDRIGDVPESGAKGIIASLRMVLFERLVAFLMLCALGLIILVVFVAGLVLSGLQQYSEQMLPGSGTFWGPLQTALSFAVNAALFAMIYHWLPKAPAPFTYTLRGSIVAAAIWEIGRQVLSALLIGTRYTDAYGVVGSFIALMLWCYYAVAVLLLGAEYIQVSWNRSRKRSDRSRHGADRAAGSPPGSAPATHPGSPPGSPPGDAAPAGERPAATDSEEPQRRGRRGGRFARITARVFDLS
jgi:membrane protein